MVLYFNKITSGLLYVSLLVLFISYTPIVYNNVWYGVCRYALYTMLGSVSVISFSWNVCLRSSILRCILVCILFIGLEFLFFYSKAFHVVWDDLIQLILVFLSILIGFNWQQDKYAVKKMIIFYCICASFLGCYTINEYVGSFVIANQYMVDGKNQLGGILAVSGAMAFYLALCIEKRKLCLFLFSIAFIFLFIIRARSAITALLMFVLFLVFRNYSLKKILIYILLLGIIFLLFYNNIVEGIYLSFLGSKDVNDLDNISSGRIGRNIEGINYFFDNFFTGELLYPSNIALIHNYLLLRFVRYGIWAFPFAILYFYIIIFILKNIRRASVVNFEQIGVYLLIIPFIISLLEPSFPFGPGSVQVFTYILFGYSLNKISKL